MILGEIIIPKTLINNERIVSAKNKGIVTIKEERIINSLLPTLIVGWANVKGMFNDKEISILNKTIRKNLYWTFAPGEDTQDFNEDIETFINHLYNDFISEVKYHFIDPIVENFSTSIELISMYENEYCFEKTYITENFIYIYDKPKNIILGIDLKYLKFLNFNIDQLLLEIKKISCQLLMEDYTDTGIYQKYKQFLNNDFDKKFIPLLVSKESELVQ